MHYILDVFKFRPDWTTDNIVSFEHLKYPYQRIMGKMVFPLFLDVYLLENYSKYFDDYTGWLSVERWLPFGLLV